MVDSGIETDAEVVLVQVASLNNSEITYVLISRNKVPAGKGNIHIICDYKNIVHLRLRLSGLREMRL